MDPGVALAQAYLHLNGYLTAAEFPILASGQAGTDTVTDVDLIALRFPHSRPLGVLAAETTAPDPALAVDEGAMDLLICEVKEGRARLNRNLPREVTLRAVLGRVGCCPPEHVAHHVADLLRHGSTEMGHGGGVRCRARLAVFAGRRGDAHRAALVIRLPHAAREVCRFLAENRERLKAARLTQPVLADLHLLDKIGLVTAAGVRAA